MGRIDKGNKKKKKVLIGVGLSVALCGIVGTATLAATDKENSKHKNDKVITKNNIEDVNASDKTDDITNVNIDENNISNNQNINNKDEKQQNEKQEVKKEEVVKKEGSIEKPSDIDKDSNNKKSDNREKIDKPTEEDKNVAVVTPTDGSNIISSAKNYAVSRFDAEKMVKGTYSGPLDNEKTVCLTFDDGPSKNTDKILDIMNKYGVHGTFFVLGEQVQSGAEHIKRIYNSGNAIGNHSYTHNFSKLYPGNKISVSAYMDEYNKTENALKAVLGNGFNTGLVRMPGGENSRQYYKDPNLSALKTKFSNAGIASVDWNALNGDAEGKKYTVQEMVDYAKRSSQGKKHVVILMHDAAAKGLTVEALPQIIEYYKSQGYNFKVIS